MRVLIRIEVVKISEKSVDDLLGDLFTYNDCNYYGDHTEAFKEAINNLNEIRKCFIEGFIDLETQILEDELEGKIDEWHESDSELLLHKYLGFTKKEYERYLNDDLDEFLKEIVMQKYKYIWE